MNDAEYGIWVFGGGVILLLIIYLIESVKLKNKNRIFHTINYGLFLLIGVSVGIYIGTKIQYINWMYLGFAIVALIFCVFMNLVKNKVE